MLGFSLKNLLVRLLAVETDIAQRVYGTMIDVIRVQANKIHVQILMN